MTPFKVGDRVGYAARFLASIGGHEVANRVGTIEEIREGNPPRARIRWDDEPEELSSAIFVNIAVVGSWRHLDPSAPKVRS